MEKMLNARMVTYLEANDVPVREQCGYREFKSTTDALVRFELYTREAFARRQHAYAVFFDNEKPYDIAWRGGILQSMHNGALRGNLPQSINISHKQKNECASKRNAIRRVRTVRGGIAGKRAELHMLCPGHQRPPTISAAGEGRQLLTCRWLATIQEGTCEWLSIVSRSESRCMAFDYRLRKRKGFTSPGARANL